MLNIKLNRRLFAEDEFDDLERLMSTYSLCQSKRSGKTFLIATKCKKHTWWYCVYAFIIPLCIGFIMLIPINKWICLLLGIAAASEVKRLQKVICNAIVSPQPKCEFKYYARLLKNIGTPEFRQKLQALPVPGLPYLKARQECCLQEVYWRNKR